MKVTLLIIRDTVNANSSSSLHTTTQGAFRELLGWVGGKWDSAGLGRAIGTITGNHARVDYFFDIRGQDYQYSINEKVVYGPAVAEEGPLDPNEVPLDPVEVRAVVHALRIASYKSVGKEIGTNSYHAADIVHKIIGKLTD